MSRSSKYTPELAEVICRLIAEGLPLTKICRREEMPSYNTVLRWLIRGDQGEPPFQDFRGMYERARQDQADTLADQILEIADDARNDTHQTEDGREGVNHELVSRSKLRVDARKWVAAKLKPRKYGDRTALEHSGRDGAPISFEALIRSASNG